MNTTQHDDNRRQALKTRQGRRLIKSSSLFDACFQCIVCSRSKARGYGSFPISQICDACEDARSTPAAAMLQICTQSSDCGICCTKRLQTFPFPFPRHPVASHDVLYLVLSIITFPGGYPHILNSPVPDSCSLHMKLALFKHQYQWNLRRH